MMFKLCVRTFGPAATGFVAGWFLAFGPLIGIIILTAVLCWRHLGKMDSLSASGPAQIFGGVELIWVGAPYAAFTAGLIIAAVVSRAFVFDLSNANEWLQLFLR